MQRSWWWAGEGEPALTRRNLFANPYEAICNIAPQMRAAHVRGALNTNIYADAKPGEYLLSHLAVTVAKVSQQLLSNVRPCPARAQPAPSPCPMHGVPSRVLTGASQVALHVTRNVLPR